MNQHQGRVGDARNFHCFQALELHYMLHVKDSDSSLSLALPLSDCRSAQNVALYLDASKFGSLEKAVVRQRLTEKTFEALEYQIRSSLARIASCSFQDTLQVLED